MFSWCFWFVWLVCWSVCCVTGGRWWVHLALLCRRVTWRDYLGFFSLCSLLSVGVASATECLPVVVRAWARRSQGKHVLRSKNEWIVRLILSALWRSVTWSVVALWRFLVGPEGSGFNQSVSRLLLTKFFIRRYFSKDSFGSYSCLFLRLLGALF